MDDDVTEVTIKDYSIHIDGKTTHIILKIDPKTLAQALFKARNPQKKNKVKEIDGKPPFDVFLGRLKKVIAEKKTKGITVREIKRDVGRLYLDEVDRALKILIDDNDIKLVRVMTAARGRKRIAYIAAHNFDESLHMVLNSDDEESDE